jgi:hypothetical protein
MTNVTGRDHPERETFRAQQWLTESPDRLLRPSFVVFISAFPRKCTERVRKVSADQIKLSTELGFQVTQLCVLTYNNVSPNSKTLRKLGFETIKDIIGVYFTRIVNSANVVRAVRWRTQIRK